MYLRISTNLTSYKITVLAEEEITFDLRGRDLHVQLEEYKNLNWMSIELIVEVD